jgi:RNA polymerase sigma factor (sigma-70 family)
MTSDQHQLLEQLFREQYPRVVAFFRRKGFSPEETQDLAQQVFLRVAKNIGQLAQPAAAIGWLMIVTTNIWKNRLRSQHAAIRSGTEISLDRQPEEHPALEIVAPQPSATDALIESEHRERLREAIASLAPRQRQILLLRLEGDLPLRTIATDLGISVDAVKTSLYQAKRRLREKLTGSGLGRAEPSIELE